MLTDRPIIVAGTRALLDVANGASELAMTLDLAGRGLVHELHHGDNRDGACRAAARTLTQALDDLAGLIRDLREMEL